MVPASVAFHLVDSKTGCENKPSVISVGYSGLSNDILDISWMELMI